MHIWLFNYYKSYSIDCLRLYNEQRASGVIVHCAKRQQMKGVIFHLSLDVVPFCTLFSANLIIQRERGQTMYLYSFDILVKLAHP